MGRKQHEPTPTLSIRLILLLVCLVSCGLVYAFVSAVLTTSGTSSVSDLGSLALVEDGATSRADENFGGDNRGCCRGIENLELWGSAVKWGSEFKFNNSESCCNACKSMCTGKDGPCLCNTWVFCGNRKTCGSKFGEGAKRPRHLNSHFDRVEVTACNFIMAVLVEETKGQLSP